MSYCHIEDGIVKGGRGKWYQKYHIIFMALVSLKIKAIIILEGEKDANTINSCMGKILCCY